MRLFLDSSAFAKRYIQEKGSADVDLLLQGAFSLGLSILSVPEIVSALCRHRRESHLTKEAYLLAKRSLLRDTEDADIIPIVPSVVARSIRILEKENVRTLDAIHLASALEWKAELFASSDQKQLATASRLELAVKLV